MLDQLVGIIQSLKNNPEDRRCVLGMWDPKVDFQRQGKDVPCNTQVYFGVTDQGALDMTVCCRSNDMVWGAYGANVVHFSMLQEFMAQAIGVSVGFYWQLSNNFHVYDATSGMVQHLLTRTKPTDLYELYKVGGYPILAQGEDPIHFLRDLDFYLDEGSALGINSPYIKKVLHPLTMAFDHFKKGEGEDKYAIPLEILEQCQADDWKLACQRWIERRHARWHRAKDDGVSHV